MTGYDIITFWVSRMITMGLEEMQVPPFQTVLIHGLVRDELGRKMSKSLGNGVDPLEVIDQYGADALRFSLVMGVSAGNDTRYIPARVESARNFANIKYIHYIRMCQDCCSLSLTFKLADKRRILSEFRLKNFYSNKPIQLMVFCLVYVRHSAGTNFS